MKKNSAGWSFPSVRSSGGELFDLFPGVETLFLVLVFTAAADLGFLGHQTVGIAFVFVAGSGGIAPAVAGAEIGSAVADEAGLSEPARDTAVFCLTFAGFRLL